VTELFDAVDTALYRQVGEASRALREAQRELQNAIARCQHAHDALRDIVAAHGKLRREVVWLREQVARGSA
jgi:hypothetical protein